MVEFYSGLDTSHQLQIENGTEDQEIIARASRFNVVVVLMPGNLVTEDNSSRFTRGVGSVTVECLLEPPLVQVSLDGLPLENWDYSQSDAFPLR